MAALLVIGACSDDGDDGSSAPQTAPDTNATVESTDAGLEVDTAAWCAAAADLNAELLAFQAVDPADLAAVEERATAVDAALHGAADAAPAELSADVETVADAFLTFFAALAAVDYDFSRLDSAVVQSLQADEALANVDEFNASNCDITSPAICRGVRATLEVAVDAFEASEGRPPANAEELVDAGL
ncbi:MAG TPA: hypothetical protein VGK49_02840, partial [Ilumatobacteraceae bacterium]